MDATDRKILALLQKDGRQTVTELAEKVQLSVSPCLRRVRQLERTGVITGYHASIDPRKAGLEFQALLFITVSRSDAVTMAAIERSLADLDEIIECQRLFGEPDFLVRVLTRTLADYQELYDQRISVIPGIERIRSTLVMRSVVVSRPIPL
ncbi:Lrp/AsnC family transcriptional regulator [Pseudoclavibacter sp. 13-3]|uniref:Lrp/AsnC family transcriptional regulator n=1 Tax=Pseudoclavibacter sp. 13-3 TaxID=2901228 RepID=UPI001E2A2826|nr:Lrp/AsnC family transcriptional regulator [Pseudoclavibacter sp. 13-3]MCD7100958.1 Lrp/AsnC family transcriptional regulator [Pseudoclavibacter sp. 13-3]